MGALIKYLRGRIAVLRGARNLAYVADMSRFLRFVRLALHRARRLNQRCQNYLLLDAALMHDGGGNLFH